MILVDDLGYGDLSCQNSASKIRTPNLDCLASQGMRFVDAHVPSALCTPSRYGLLTGQYCWRSRLKSGVLNMWDEPLIAPERLTVAGLLRNQGYLTACFGKWHLGLAWPFTGRVPEGFDTNVTTADIDWSHRIAGGPVDHGFDYYFGVNLANEPPYAFIQNDHVVGLPSVDYPTVTGQQSHWAGPGVAGWDWTQTLPVLTSNTVNWIEQAASTGQSQPFFLYLALVGPHQPVAPSAQFQGTSQAGIYGDYVQELDWSVGQVLAALDRTGATNNTLVLFTSDNGPDEFAYARIQKYRHASMGSLRGIKCDIWEGGHRVPFVARWPGKIVPGTISSATISLIGFMRTVADITAAQIPADAAEDSISFLPALLGNQPATKQTLILESAAGQFGLRSNNWMYIDSCTGDGHNPELEPLWFKQDRGYLPGNPLPALLYDLDLDLAERTNLLGARPDMVIQLSNQLRQGQAVSTWQGTVSGSWTTTNNWVPACLPSGTDIVYGNSAGTAHFSQSIGCDLAINSIRLAPLIRSNLTIGNNAGCQLTIANGIDMSMANANLTLNSDLITRHSQQWNVATNHVLVVNGSLATRGCELLISGSGNVFLVNTISDSGRLTIRNSGYTVLKGSNSFSGGVENSGGGVLCVENDHALGSGTLSIPNNSTLRLFAGISVTNTAEIQGEGALYDDIRQGAVELWGSGPARYDGSLTLAGSARFHIQDAGGVLALGGGVNGAGGLVKSGPGTLILSNTNIYTGDTSVGDGTLLVAGLLDNTAVNVTGGILSGTGIVAGRVTIGNGGVLSIAISQMPLVISGDLLLSTGAVTRVEIDSRRGTSGLVEGIGTAKYDGLLSLTNLASGPLTNGQSFHLFTASNGEGRFNQITPEPGAGLVWSFDAVSGNLTALSPTKLNIALLDSSNLVVAWSIPGFHLQIQTNATGLNPRGPWFDFPAGRASPVTVPLPSAPGGLYLRLVAP